MLKAALAGEELLFLTGLGTHAIDFVALELNRVESLTEFGSRALDGAKARHGCGQGFPRGGRVEGEGRHLRLGVEKGAVRLFAQEALALVLTVNVHE